MQRIFSRRLRERSTDYGWDFKSMREDYGVEYLGQTDPDNCPMSMADIGECFTDVAEAIRATCYGERFGFKQDSFNYNDDYFAFNAYANLVSIPSLKDYLKEYVEEEDLKKWCIEEGYFSEEDED